MAEGLEFECVPPVAHIWLIRPDKRNSITLDMLKRMDLLFNQIDRDESLRVLILRGRENTFSSGFDLGKMRADFLGSQESVDLARVPGQVCQRLHTMQTPSVAVVEGYAAAGGFELLLSCDFAIAETTSNIGDIHIRRGLMGGAGPTYRLPRLIGERRAKELLLTGRFLSGAEAKAWGLVNETASSTDLDAVVGDFVDTIVDKSTFQIGLVKRILDQSFDTSVQAMMVMEELAVANTFNSADAAEGVAAFLEKRDPEWKGR